MLIEKETHALNHCPRCKSGQLEGISGPEFDKDIVFERLTCLNCGIEVVQAYRYEYTWGEWDEEEEA